MKDLETLRKEIDQLDQEIVKYYEKRMEAVLQVMEFKRQKRLPIFHGGREKQVLNRVVESLENKDFAQETRLLYSEIMRISRKRQSQELFPFHIALVGFMGTGKSTISASLSEMLEMEWIDLDDKIERNMGITIKQIFEKYGEDGFRRIETEALKEAIEENHKIISCGGGIPLKEENREILKKGSKVVLLQASSTSIYQRLKDDDTRPLLKDNMTLQYIENLLRQREESYIKVSDLVVSTDEKEVNDISMEIIDKLLGR